MIETVKKERKLLKQLMRESDKYDHGFIPIENKLINKDDYYFRELVRKHFVKTAEVKYETDARIDPKPKSIQLTNLGKHYFEHRFEVTKELMFKSFWLPIAVAFVTSLLTNGVLYTIRLLLK
ncbi:hypothetical protein [Limosilactobacillus reuteri]|uniref:hypothetical protein n=1 Tax=Limosilactobacillus reuteri TaxID=1598 RepID=UPI001E631F19|nr:hypothetical protein [Limosilactobacillus reuteri]MCC4467315.1 hypothetical protein [Limosilactobacillus reuteri]MCC4473994.1 hypothetical protein [Limosilactobacillus reuteri]MCT3201434.1 hypothetical protein [Limosilactobacillus reuteri]